MSVDRGSKMVGARTGFLYDEIYLRHDTGSGHPERPERLTAIVAQLKRTGLFDTLTPIGATPAEVKWLYGVHSPEYVRRVKSSCETGVGHVDSPDVPACARSYEVAVVAVGGVLAAVDQVMAGKVANAFCAVRPPGHHALPDRAMGFCLFNNVAVAARYLQQHHKVEKVLIVDWDVHHGNGTQDIFYDDPTVFYFSVHQSPFYPGTGARTRPGRARARSHAQCAALRRRRRCHVQTGAPRPVETGSDGVQARLRADLRGLRRSRERPARQHARDLQRVRRTDADRQIHRGRMLPRADRVRPRGRVRTRRPRRVGRGAPTRPGHSAGSRVAAGCGGFSPSTECSASATVAATRAESICDRRPSLIRYGDVVGKGSPRRSVVTRRGSSPRSFVRRGLMSHSRWKICCHVPSASSPSATGTESDGPSSVACRWEWPLPSCQACS